jgi:flavin reductase (DIM6/NTAB) family NADH-FMN oxidoreductase RutF
VPRPIALVTTVDPQGRVNAAPFSFFNCLSADPPILALGVENHPDMRFKDTGLNIRLTEVFTVNIVSRAIAEAMHVCAVPFAPDADELKAAGLTAMPSSSAKYCSRIITPMSSTPSACASIRQSSMRSLGSAATPVPPFATVSRC